MSGFGGFGGLVWLGWMDRGFRRMEGGMERRGGGEAGEEDIEGLVFGV